MDAKAACAVKPVIAIKPKSVSVTGVEISRAAISRETQNHPSRKPTEAWISAARALAIRELLLQQARALSMRPEPLADEEGRRETDEEALVRGVIEREVVTPEPDEATCRRYYTQNFRRFRSADLCEVSHILFAADPRDAAARETARRRACTLIEALAASPDQFGHLAREESDCPSREVDGNLGQICPGQTVPEFEKALAAIPAGTVHAEPIASRYGCHVVRVNHRVEGRQLPFELVQDKISSYLAEHVRRTAIRQYISVLAGQAVITGLDLGGTHTPLVH